MVSVLDDAEDVVLAQDEVLFAVELDLGAGVLAKENAVAFSNGESNGLAINENGSKMMVVSPKRSPIQSVEDSSRKSKIDFVIEKHLDKIKNLKEKRER